MCERRHYPPPDLSPPLNSFLQEQPRDCSFFPDNWSEQDPPETSWAYNYSRDYGASTRYEDETQYTWQDHGTHRPYGQSFGQPWRRAGHRRWKRRWYMNKKPVLHVCDDCNREFKSTESYNEHMALHVKCSFPDCNFEGHEKVVKSHMKYNHEPGGKLIKNESAEIAKWREERRKNYPTNETVEKKKNKMEMKEETDHSIENHEGAETV